MTDWSQIGRILLLMGLGLALVGGAIMLSAGILREAKLPWLGNLPGNIRIDREGFSCYFPLLTSILISLLLTIVLNIVIRLLRR